MCLYWKQLLYLSYFAADKQKWIWEVAQGTCPAKWTVAEKV